MLKIWLLCWETAVEENYRSSDRISVMQKYDNRQVRGDESLEWHFVAIGRNFLETYGMGSC